MKIYKLYAKLNICLPDRQIDYYSVQTNKQVNKSKQKSSKLIIQFLKTKTFIYNFLIILLLIKLDEGRLMSDWLDMQTFIRYVTQLEEAVYFIFTIIFECALRQLLFVQVLLLVDTALTGFIFVRNAKFIFVASFKLLEVLVLRIISFSGLFNSRLVLLLASLF